MNSHHRLSRHGSCDQGWLQPSGNGAASFSRSRRRSAPDVTRGLYRATGFTFVELVLTLMLIAITAVPMSRMFAVAVEQTGTVDEMRTALDLAREEIEKVKNLALTEAQLKELGNLVNPPLILNNTVFYTVRLVDPDATPLQITVHVFRDSLKSSPLVSMVTVVSK